MESKLKTDNTEALHCNNREPVRRPHTPIGGSLGNEHVIGPGPMLDSFISRFDRDKDFVFSLAAVDDKETLGFQSSAIVSILLLFFRSFCTI